MSTSPSIQYNSLKKEFCVESGIPKTYFDELYSQGHIAFPNIQELMSFFCQTEKQTWADKEKKAKYYQGCWWSRGLNASKKFCGLDNWVQLKLSADLKNREQIHQNERARRENKDPASVGKYRSSVGIPARCQFFPLPAQLTEGILNNPNFKPIEGCTWELIRRRPDIPIIIIEGAKKAIVLQGYGYVVIALPGVWQGQRKVDCGGFEARKILKEIEMFCQEGRQFYICFDNDPMTKEGTRRNVGQALVTLARLIHPLTKVSPKVITWTQPEKGADDLIVAHGIGAFHEAYKNAIIFPEWECEYNLNLFGHVDVELNRRYMGDVPIPSDKAVIAIKGIEGLGKTRTFIPLVKEYAAQGKKTIILIHRELLKNGIAQAVNLPTVEQVFNGENIDGRYPGMVACVDSIYKVAMLMEDDPEGYQVVCDEFTQVLLHLMTSSTEVKRDRSGNLMRFSDIVGKSDRFIVADADINNISWDFAKKLKPGNSYVIWNKYKYNRRVTLWQDNTRMLFCGIFEAIRSGGKVFIPTQGQTRKAGYGTRNLEKIIRAAFPHLKILRIDSHTINDPRHPAYRAADHINELVKNYDVVICSPSLGTGVSIDEGHHFTHEFCYAMGKGTPMDAVQLFSRLRGDDVIRNIYAAPRGLETIGNGQNTYKGLIAGIEKVNEMLIKAMSRSGISIDDVEDLEGFKYYWARWGALYNVAKASHSAWVKRILELRGYQITVEGEKGTKEEKKDVRESAELEDLKYYEMAEGCVDVTEDERQKLSESKTLNDDERAIKLKANFKYHTGNKIEATAERLRKYEQDNWLFKVRLHLQIVSEIFKPQVDDAIAIERVSKKRKTFSPEKNSRVTSPRIEMLKQLGCDRLLAAFTELPQEISKMIRATVVEIPGEGEGEKVPYVYINNNSSFSPNPTQIDVSSDQSEPTGSTKTDYHSKAQFSSNNPLILEVCAAARRLSFEVKSVLGFTPHKSNIPLIKQLLGLIGLTTVTEGVGKKTLYQIVGCEDGRYGYWEHLIERKRDPEYVYDTAVYFIDSAVKPAADIVTSLGREIKAGFEAACDQDIQTVEEYAAIGREILAEQAQNPSKVQTSSKPAQPSLKAKQLTVLDGLKNQKLFERGELPVQTQTITPEIETAIAPPVLVVKEAPTVDDTPVVGDWVFVGNGAIRLAKLEVMESDRTLVLNVGDSKPRPVNFSELRKASLQGLADYLQKLVSGNSARLETFVEGLRSSLGDLFGSVVSLAGVWL